MGATAAKGTPPPHVGKDVTAKVTLGPRLFKTQPGVLDGGRIESWNSDFSFPVMNLRDKLMISICDSEDHAVTQTAIEIPSIIQNGSRDEFVSLSKGGLIHLRMSFILTDEERKKIETMRVAALKSREEAGRLKNTVVFQPIQDTPENKSKEFVVTAEVDIPTTFDRKESKDPLNVSLGLCAPPKHSVAKSEAVQSPLPVPKPAPKLMFNYAKAIGMHSRSRTTERRLTLIVPDNTSEIDVSYRVSSVKEGAKVTQEVHSFEAIKFDSSSVTSSGCRDRGFPFVSLSNPIPPEGSDSSTCNGGTISEIHSGRKRAEDVWEIGLSDASIEIPSRTCVAASIVRKPTDSRPLSQNLMNALTNCNADKDPDGKIVSKSAGSPGLADSSGTSKRDPPVVDASPGIGHGSSSMGNSLSKATLPHSRIFSGLVGVKNVKARLKRRLSEVSPTRCSRRTSSVGVVTRTHQFVPVVWLPSCVRKALSDVKGCFGAPA